MMSKEGVSGITKIAADWLSKSEDEKSELVCSYSRENPTGIRETIIVRQLQNQSDPHSKEVLGVVSSWLADENEETSSNNKMNALCAVQGQSELPEEMLKYIANELANPDEEIRFQALYDLYQQNGLSDQVSAIIRGVAPQLKLPMLFMGGELDTFLQRFKS